MAKSVANQLSPSQVLGRVATVLRLLEEEGLPYEAWQIPIDDPEKRRLLVQFWKDNMCLFPQVEPGEQQVDMALRWRSLPDPRKIVGPVHDAEAVNKLLSLGYNEGTLLAFGPPPDALPGFLTFFDPGWCLLYLRQFSANKDRIFHNQDWYNYDDFSKRVQTPCYRQIRWEAIDGSINKNFDDQQRLLPANEEIPLARAVCMGMVIHFLLSGQRLFKNYYVRCLDKCSDGHRVNVGYFGSVGFIVGHCWDDRRASDIGLTSSRKF